MNNYPTPEEVQDERSLYHKAWGHLRSMLVDWFTDELEEKGINSSDLKVIFYPCDHLGFLDPHYISGFFFREEETNLGIIPLLHVNLKPITDKISKRSDIVESFEKGLEEVSENDFIKNATVSIFEIPLVFWFGDKTVPHCLAGNTMVKPDEKGSHYQLIYLFPYNLEMEHFDLMAQNTHSCGQ